MIACIAVPYFATAVERRADDALREQPLVLGGQPWEPKPLYAFSQEAAQRGVAPGMSLRLAHALLPQARFLPATPPRYHDAAGEIVDVLTDFTHLLEPEELWLPLTAAPEQNTPGGRCQPARYYLDLETLPLAEALPLVQEAGRALRRETRLSAAVGVAPGRLAAQIAAALARPNCARPIEAEKESAFVAACPVEHLPLDKETARRLRLLGIRTLGQLARLPPAALREQFGPLLARYHRLTQTDGAGDISRMAARRQPVQATLRLASPLTDSLTLATAVARLAAAVVEQLQAAGVEGRRLQLAWEGEREGNQAPPAARQASRVLRRPTAETTVIVTVLRELLRESDWCGPAAAAAGGVAALSVVVTDLSPAAAQQLSIWGDTAAADQVEKTVTNLAAKYGAGCFYRPVVTDSRHPLAERRFQLAAATAS